MENNVIANIRKIMVEASDKVEYFDFNYNILIGLIPRPNAADAWDLTYGIDIHNAITKPFSIKHNILQGIDGVGFLIPGGKCGETNVGV